ncbi:MAG: cytidine deaminase [Planctomycetota bacterium]|nr:cytidine deaminase [Planctomycetota bacterium]
MCQNVPHQTTTPPKSAVPQSEPMDDATRQQLILAAQEARAQAYATYSEFTVGAALLTTDGRLIRGCNVENRSLGLTQCAERVAVGNAVVKGYRNFQALAIASRTGVTPCGACRQVLAEFCEDLPILLVQEEPVPETREVSLRLLLPDRFGPGSP